MVAENSFMKTKEKTKKKKKSKNIYLEMASKKKISKNFIALNEQIWIFVLHNLYCLPFYFFSFLLFLSHKLCYNRLRYIDL